MPLTLDPSLERVLADVDPKWHIDFVQFVQTGKAALEFLDLLDVDAVLQQAVEQAIFADEGDIREPYQKIIETNGSLEGDQKSEYAVVLRDVKLAAAALEEASRIATSKSRRDLKVDAALDDALRASRSAVAILTRLSD